MKIRPLLYGGGQEKGIRAGTENAAGIIGMGMALKIACDSMEQRRCREQYLRDYLNTINAPVYNFMHQVYWCD